MAYTCYNLGHLLNVRTTKMTFHKARTSRHNVDGLMFRLSKSDNRNVNSRPAFSSILNAITSKEFFTAKAIF